MARSVLNCSFSFKVGRYVFSKSISYSKIHNEAREFTIPTCYGHIAGKVWGPENGRKVLALHGWQDNCGTFDTLVPLLPDNLRVVSFDFPGHGLSSHKPHGTLYSFLDLLLDMKVVSSHVNWKQFSLMGHSMGGAAALFYACCFPDEIDSLVTIDIMDPDVKVASRYGSTTARLINKIFTLNMKLNNPAPIYTLEEASRRLLEGQKTFMTEVGVSHLMKRAVRPSMTDHNKYIFTRDLRLQGFIFQPNSPEVWIGYLKSLQCNLLQIKASQGVKAISRSSEVGDFLEQHFQECKKQFQVVEVDGLHHVHLEHPERLASHLSEFLTRKET